MSNTCATCRFAERSGLADWVDPNDTNLAPSELRALEMEQRFPFACQRSRMAGGEPQDPETLAFTMDGSQYRGELLVSANYGCVMYRAAQEGAP